MWPGWNTSGALRLRSRPGSGHGFSGRGRLADSVGVARPSSWQRWPAELSKPDGLLVVEPDPGGRVPHPADRGALGVGSGEAERDGHPYTVGDVGPDQPGATGRVIGESAAAHLLDLANGRDPGRSRRASGASRSARARSRGGSRDRSEVDSLAAALVDRTARRLRAAERACRTVSIGLRFRVISRASWPARSPSRPTRPKRSSRRSGSSSMPHARRSRKRTSP